VINFKPKETHIHFSSMWDLLNQQPENRVLCDITCCCSQK